MRVTRLTSRDATATLFVAAALTLYSLTEAGVDLPGVGSTRMRALAMFLLGMLACGAGAASNAFTERGIVRPPVAALSILGFATLVVGIVAIVAGSRPLMTALAVGIGLLWLGATVRHLATPSDLDTATAAEAPRELVKR